MNKSGIIERVKIRKCLERDSIQFSRENLSAVSDLVWKQEHCLARRKDERKRERRNEEGENGLNRCLPDKFLATIVNFASRISRQRSMEKNANEGDEF